jgi:hypothetical protein
MRLKLLCNFTYPMFIQDNYHLVLRSWLIDLQVRYVLENCKEDMEFFNQWVEKGIITRLTVCYLKYHLNLLPLV